jgi:hypothetical protein
MWDCLSCQARNLPERLGRHVTLIYPECIMEEGKNSSTVTLAVVPIVKSILPHLIVKKIRFCIGAFRSIEIDKKAMYTKLGGVIERNHASPIFVIVATGIVAFYGFVFSA